MKEILYIVGQGAEKVAVFAIPRNLFHADAAIANGSKWSGANVSQALQSPLCFCILKLPNFASPIVVIGEADRDVLRVDVFEIATYCSSSGRSGFARGVVLEPRRAFYHSVADNSAATPA